MAEEPPTAAAEPSWTCVSCGVVVRYEEPLRKPQIFTDVTGRTTFLMNGSQLHQCAKDA
jgi:hypothetical protein